MKKKSTTDALVIRVLQELKNLEKKSFVPASQIQPRDPSMAGAMEEQMAMEQGVDPQTGLPIDPQTGLPFDEQSGMLIDPQSGMMIEPLTGIVFDPQSGQPMDPQSGQPMDPQQAEQMIMEAHQQMQMQGGQPGMEGQPPMDPAMGGQPPMDPGMEGQPPMDPGMEMAPDGLPADGMGGQPQPDPNQGLEDSIRKVLEETGVVKPQKLKPAEQFDYLINVLEKITQHLGIEMPPPPGAGGMGVEEGAGGVPKIASDKKARLRDLIAELRK